MGRASRNKRERRLEQEPAWEPLVRATHVWNRSTKETVELDPQSELWMNHTYNAHLYRHSVMEPDVGPDLLHVAITRKDQAPVRDWRAFQRIKNQLFGDRVEAVELFPSEDRLVDSANTYHLWGFDDPEWRFPFGFTTRLVMTPEETAAVEPGAKQRAFGTDPSTSKSQSPDFGIANV